MVAAPFSAFLNLRTIFLTSFASSSQSYFFMRVPAKIVIASEAKQSCPVYAIATAEAASQ
jgi:hypothetical protein